MPGGERRVELNVNLDELERRLVVCYTGKPRQSAINNWAVFKAHIDDKGSVKANLERISQIAQKMRIALESGDWKESGRLMNVEWQFRCRQSVWSGRWRMRGPVNRAGCPREGREDGP